MAHIPDYGPLRFSQCGATGRLRSAADFPPTFGWCCFLPPLRSPFLLWWGDEFSRWVVQCNLLSDFGVCCLSPSSLGVVALPPSASSFRWSCFLPPPPLCGGAVPRFCMKLTVTEKTDGAADLLLFLGRCRSLKNILQNKCLFWKISFSFES